MKKRTRWLLVIVTVVVIASVALLWFGRCPIKYEMILLPNNLRYIQDINDSGMVVGGTFVSAFFWNEREGFKDLGTFGFTKATAVDINNAGQILIRATVPNEKTQGLLLDPASGVYDPNAGVTNLGTLGGAETFPRAMNEQGQVVGMSNIASETGHAFYWDPVSGMEDIGTLCEKYSSIIDSQAYDISESGQVVGVSYTGVGGQEHAFMWTADTDMVDLTPSYTYSSSARSINSKGKIVGTISDSLDNISWCEWNANTAAQTGTSSPAKGILLEINNFGQVFGYYEQPRPFDKPVRKYFLEDPENRRIYLDRFIKPRGWRIQYAIMNKEGWIAGSITEKDGYHYRCFILKPVKD